MRNSHLENIILSGIDVNEPNVKYAYSGLGFELAAKAMELVAGRPPSACTTNISFARLVLAMCRSATPVPTASSRRWNSASSPSGSPTAAATALGVHRSPDVRPTAARAAARAHRGFVEDEGIGLHWIRHLKPGAPTDSKRAEDLLFSPRTLGHGSFSGCIFVVDPERQLVITQVRKQSGPAAPSGPPGSSRPSPPQSPRDRDRRSRGFGAGGTGRRRRPRGTEKRNRIYCS